MDLTKLTLQPFVEGFIRVATVKAADTGKLEFNGQMQILDRHHDASKSHASGDPALATHPIEAELIKGHSTNQAEGKLIEIPIRMFFNRPEKAIQASYVAYDQSGLPVCTGDGCNAKRRHLGEEGVQVVTDQVCPGNEQCTFAKSGAVACKRQVSMLVQIKGQRNSLSVFDVRTSSFNSLKTLKGQIAMINARFGGLRHVPLKLQLWQTSNQASEYESFDVFKLCLDAPDEAAAMKVCKQQRDEETSAGLGVDIDAIFEAGDVHGLDQCADFGVVKDFYQPIILSSDAQPQKPTSPSAIIGAHKVKHSNVIAADLISSAVKSARAAEETAATAELDSVEV